jgi:uncharacterized protein
MPSVPPPQTVPDAVPPTPPPPQQRGDDEPPWGPWTVPAAVLVGLGIGILTSAIVQIVAAAAGSSVSHPPPAVSLIENLVFDLSFVAAAIYFALRAAGALRPADFGFRRISPALGIGAMLAAAVGYYVVTAVYASLVKLHGSDKLPSELGVNKSTAALVGAAVFVCVIAPMAEELFFRGFIFGALRRWRIPIGGREAGTWLAAIVTGIFFGLVHAGSAAAQYLIPLAFLGFVLCLVRWRTRSLYPCMALHSINNCLALGINELHWSALAIGGLMVAALLVIASITGPLSGPWRRPLGGSPGPAAGGA